MTMRPLPVSGQKQLSQAGAEAAAQSGEPPSTSSAAPSVIDEAMADGRRDFVPRKVLLFSGHLADAPGRHPPRFPKSMETAAAQRIGDVLDQLQAGPEDLALTQGASGGDILFLEACHARGVRLQLMLPLPEPEFVRQSILPATDGERWAARYRHLRTQLAAPPQVLNEEPAPALPLSSLPADNPFARCNLWLLNTALAFGIDRLAFICLWNGAKGDGPGGTAHMVDEVERRGGRIFWIDTRSL